MLLLVPVVIAVAAALARGGSLHYLATLPIRGSAFILASFAIQVALYLPGVRGAPLVLRWGGAIYVVAMLLALTGALCNWRLGAGVRVATLGLALNALAIAANGGYMPVGGRAMSAVQGTAKIHELAGGHLYENTHLAGPSTRLPMLCDIIPVRLPGGFGNVYSVGDVLITVGIAALAYQATVRSWE